MGDPWRWPATTCASCAGGHVRATCIILLQMPPLPSIEGWTRTLDGDRLEIFLKAEKIKGAPDRKIRASGPREEMYELVDWFEQKTGLRVNVPNRVRTGPAPLPGQTTFTMGDMTQEETPVG